MFLLLYTLLVTFNTSLRPYFPSVETMSEILFSQCLLNTSVDFVFTASTDSERVAFDAPFNSGNSQGGCRTADV